MAYCPACGEEVADGAVECSECGEQLETVQDQGEEQQAHTDMRDNWWHVLVAVPLFIPLVRVSELLAAVYFLLWLMLPVAVWYDAKYVRAASDTWRPGKKLTAAAAALCFVTAGFLTYVYTPAYLYMRYKHV